MASYWKLKTRKCECCGKDYYFHRKNPNCKRDVNYCSEVCHRRSGKSVQSYSRIKWLDCVVCESKFAHSGKKPPESGTAIGHKPKTCSKKCQEKLMNNILNNLKRYEVQMVLCLQCGECFKPKTKRYSQFCSRQCYFTAKGNGVRTAGATYNTQASKRRRQRIKQNGGKRSITRKEKHAVFKRDGWECHYCNKRVKDTGIDMTPDTATIDHIVPITSGGTHKRSNLVTACMSCNSKKGTASYEDFTQVGVGAEFTA